MKRSHLLPLGAALALSLAAAGCAESTDEKGAAFPSETIELVIPYGPGGANDRVARKIANIATEEGIVDQSIIVTNVPSAATQAGIRQVASAQADGHKLLVHHNAMVAASVLGQLPDELYWQDALVPVAQMLSTPLTFAVPADSPYESMEDLFEAAASDEAIAIGLPGMNAPQTFAFETVVAAYEGEVGPVPAFNRVFLEGGAEVKTASLSGTVAVVPGITMDTVPDAKGGLYRILAVVADERLDVLADVPTLAETGLPSPSSDGALEMVVWAPAGTPDDVVAELERILAAVYETEAWQQFVIEENSAVAVWRTGDEVHEAFRTYEEAITAVLPRIQQG